MNETKKDLSLKKKLDNSPISINKNIERKEENSYSSSQDKNESFQWLTEHSRKFLSAGYIPKGGSPEKRIREIGNRAEEILGINGFSDKFYKYMELGYYSLSSPVWSNFGKKRGLPISCFGSNISDDMGNILYTQSEVGMMSKLGGGTSGYFGHIRPNRR